MNNLSLKVLKNKINTNFKWVSLYNNSIMYSDSVGKHVVKNNDNNIINIYNYLNSRGFNYLPELEYYDNDIYIYKFVNDITMPKEQRASDLIKLDALLHNKTIYHVDISLDEIKEIYESLNYKINDTLNFYDNEMNKIESSIYMSPGEYMLARNCSSIFSCINFCKNWLEKWYEIIKNKKRKRVVLLHNNLSLDHVLKSDSTVLIGLNKIKSDMPIYDFISFYKNNYEKYDFNNLFMLYESKFPLLEEEKILLFVILFLPDKIINNGNEMKYTLDVSRLCNYLYTTDKLFMEQDFENKKKQDNKINEQKKYMESGTQNKS